MNKRLVFVLLSFFVLILPLTQAEAGTLYATDDGTNNIYAIDTATGAASLVGASVEDLSFTGLAYNTSTGTMYVSDVTIPTGGFGLGRVDLITGAVTVIGTHFTSDNIWGLAYDSLNNVLYGSDDDNGPGLAIIGMVTGAASLVGSFTVLAPTKIAGLAYDSSTDILYGISSTNL